MSEKDQYRIVGLGKIFSSDYKEFFENSRKLGVRGEFNPTDNPVTSSLRASHLIKKAMLRYRKPHGLEVIATITPHGFEQQKFKDAVANNTLKFQPRFHGKTLISFDLITGE